MKKNHREFSDPKIRSLFDSFHPITKKKLLLIRELIFTTGSKIDLVGDLLKH